MRGAIINMCTNNRMTRVIVRPLLIGNVFLVNRRAACSLEGRLIWPLLPLLYTAHAQYNFQCLSKHPVFDIYRKCTGNVEVK